MRWAQQNSVTGCYNRMAVWKAAQASRPGEYRPSVLLYLERPEHDDTSGRIDIDIRTTWGWQNTFRKYVQPRTNFHN